MTQLKKILLYLFALFSIIGCKKEGINEQIKESQNKKIEVLNTTNYQGYWGEYLSDTVFIRIKLNDLTNYDIRSKFVKGNGFIDYAFSDKKVTQGVFGYLINLGCNTNEQQIIFYLYERITEKLLDSVSISVVAKQPSGWCKACGIKGVDKIRFYNNVFYTISENKVYYSNDNGINWFSLDKVNREYYSNDIQFNNSGWAFVLTENSGILRSNDFISWEKCGDIKDPRYPTTFLVEDSDIFVGFDFDGLYRSINNGDSWEKLSLADNGKYHLLTRHPNGDLYMVDNWDNIMKSSDNGNTWKNLNIKEPTISTPVADIEIDKNGQLYIGDLSVATLSILSTATYTGVKHLFHGGKLDNIQIINDIVYFCVKGNLTPGIYSSDNNWSKLNIGFNDYVRSFYLKNDNYLLISGNTRIYYYNKEK